MEYTQEQIDKMIADAKAEATKGLFTKEDLEKEVTREVDRRVETGIQKGIETAHSKWQEEADRKAKLTAEQLAEEKLQEQLGNITARETELNVRANKLDALSKLSTAGVPQSYYEKLLGNLINGDADVTSANVDNLIEVYTTTKTQIEADIKAKMANVAPPAGGGAHDGEMTKEKFSKLSYSDKLELKSSKPEVFKAMMA